VLAARLGTTTTAGYGSFHTTRRTGTAGSLTARGLRQASNTQPQPFLDPALFGFGATQRTAAADPYHTHLETSNGDYGRHNALAALYTGSQQAVTLRRLRDQSKLHEELVGNRTLRQPPSVAVTNNDGGATTDGGDADEMAAELEGRILALEDHIRAEREGRDEVQQRVELLARLIAQRHDLTRKQQVKQSAKKPMKGATNDANAIGFLRPTVSAQTRQRSTLGTSALIPTPPAPGVLPPRGRSRNASANAAAMAASVSLAQTPRIATVVLRPSAVIREAAHYRRGMPSVQISG
jgi:hypothetical protein